MFDVRKSKRAYIKTKSGWISSPSCCCPIWGWKAQVLWKKADGTFVVLGQGFSKRSKHAAQEKAINAANEYMNKVE
jgi:hypothetical protein